MSALFSFAKGLPALCRSADQMRHSQPEQFWFTALFWSFWLSLALFPIGYGAREVMPVVSFLFLLAYYRHAWAHSVLRRLTVRPLFYAFWLMIVLGIVCSTHVWASLLHAGTGINKGFILPFIAMECVRSEKDLRRLVWACVLACVWQGLDGIWQACTGFDFIMGYGLNAGRLTGSLGDYSVGNYIALALIPSFGLWSIVRQNKSFLRTALLCALVLAPAFFLLAGASSRSGMLAVAAALALGGIMYFRRWLPFAVCCPTLFLLFFSYWQPHRLTTATIMGDGRWSLWSLAWQVFQEYPWFGAGAGQYNAAFRALGLVPQKDAITISHPHNIFLDLLYAHGIIGFTLGMIFLMGFLFWGLKKIRPQVLAEKACKSTSLYWRLGSWFWIGYAGWLVNGIFGHDFYRIWWLALAMSYLGIMIGVVVNGKNASLAVKGQHAAMPARYKPDTKPPATDPQ